jgi:hypothetical protein
MAALKSSDHVHEVELQRSPDGRMANCWKLNHDDFLTGRYHGCAVHEWATGRGDCR